MAVRACLGGDNSVDGPEREMLSTLLFRIVSLFLAYPGRPDRAVALAVQASQAVYTVEWVTTQ